MSLAKRIKSRLKNARRLSEQIRSSAIYALGSSVLSKPDAYWAGMHEYCLRGDRYDLVKVLPNGFDYPIYLRRGTSDVSNYSQIFNKQEYGFIANETPPLTILDLGGYIGLASVYFAKLFPESRVLLVEPDPDNYTMALLNCRGYKNITCVNYGAWSKSCFIRFSRETCGDWSNMFEELQIMTENPPLAAIQAKSVPEFMSIGGFEFIDFLKIDIEGSEKVLFDDPCAETWISKCKLISCEIHDSLIPGCSESVYTAVAKAGFSSYKHGEYDYFVKK